MKHVLVVGGANTDIVGVPGQRLSMQDSNPGHVSATAGGVGRNIAENLVRLGMRVTLLTAFGDDEHGRARRAECEAAGIDVARSLVSPGVPGPVYLAILDEQGDLAVAVSDMRALEALGAREIAEVLSGPGALEPPDALVLDANPGEEALIQARSLMPDTPLFLECVSLAKAPRLAGVLRGATAIHANVREAAVLVDLELEDSLEGAARGADALVALGVAAAYVTAGEHGTAFASSAARGTVPPPTGGIVNATGAGDAFTAGVVTATLEERKPGFATAYAHACAAITMASEHAAAPDLDRHTVEAWMEANPG